MFLSDVFEAVLALFEPFVYDGVCSLAVEPDFAIVLENNRHPLPDIVEVEDAEEVVQFLLAIGGDGDAAGGAGEESVAKITGR